MAKIRLLPIEGYETVIEAWEEKVGLHCFIALHSCALGPALGGIRIMHYSSREAALNDVLRLSKGMTYKSSLAKLGLGGGKAVIMLNDNLKKTDEMLQAFAEVVNALDGSYICAEDAGSSVEDMGIINQVTPYVVGVEGLGRSGDPSPYTAYGTLCGIKAVAHVLWQKNSLEGVHIAIQGLGHVGRKLAELLFWEGAKLTVSDIDSNRVEECVKSFGARTVPAENFMEVECDILAPCALGGILNSKSIPLLRCKAIAGAANNQLERSEDGVALMDKGILYAPDYVINSGGILSVVDELSSEGFIPQVAREKVADIYDTLLKVVEKSVSENKAANQVADEMAEQNIREGISRREGPLFIAGYKLKEDCRKYNFRDWKKIN